MRHKKRVAFKFQNLEGGGWLKNTRLFGGWQKKGGGELEA